MDGLDDVGSPAVPRVERGRGSVHNGVADQALANPDMSIAELLFAVRGDGADGVHEGGRHDRGRGSVPASKTAASTSPPAPPTCPSPTSPPTP
mmetsp:Transcript_23313/g.74673  ORF Transcript_23313/g.74673 Transcript_23313/m.74673 type:complete len:93 (-) Transcript_23313:460-738(-)